MRRRPALVLLALAAAAPALAAPRSHPAKQTPANARPSGRLLGQFEDWTALTREEAGQTVCYAFAYPTTSTPAVSGRGRPVLTVTERPSGRDAVAFSAGFALAANAETNLQVEQAALGFYASGRFAFARDGAAAVAALRRGRQATMRSPGPRGRQIVDTFRLRGFEQAYAAVAKACPSK